MNQTKAHVHQIKRFVAQTTQVLRDRWERTSRAEDGFFWMSSLDVTSHDMITDLSGLFNNIPLEMTPRQTEAIISDAINIMTYENRIVEAVLCRNSTQTPRKNDTFNARTVVSFNYHGSLGHKINSCPLCVLDSAGLSVLDKPSLGDFEKPLADVTKWREADFGPFRDLLPHQTITTNVFCYENKWYISICDIVPKILPDKSENGFPSKYEALEFVKMMGEHIREQRVEGLILPKINKELYDQRKKRCPMKIGITHQR